MFKTISHTFELMKMSWRVLMKDKELIWFPIFGVIGSLIILGIFFLIASATGAIASRKRPKESMTTPPGQPQRWKRTPRNS